jgi:hypothetical protein
MNLRRPRVLVLLLAFAVLAAIVWQGEHLLDAVLDWRYHATLSKPTLPPPTDAAEADRQDLDYLARLPSVDRSFAPAASAAFEQRIATLRTRAGGISRAELVLGAAEAVALADNGHTNVDPDAWRALLASVPVRFAWFADGLYVVRATSAYGSLLGSQVLAIDGRAPSLLDAETRRYFGGPPEHAHAWNVLILESPEALHAMHPGAPEDRLVIRVRDPAGPERTIELPAILPKDTFGASVPARLLSPVPLGVEKGTDWRALLDADAVVPPSLRAPRQLFYSTELPGRVLYMHLWQVRDDDNRTLDAAIRNAVGPSNAPRWPCIVLDLRFNGGGDYTTAYGAIKSLPDRLVPDGRLMILTDNTTFSAAIVVAAWARHYTGARAKIIGERIGDRLAFWAEGRPIELPNSKLPVSVATGYHDWANGCREYRCYWPNFYYDVAAGNLEPDVVVGWRFDDYRRGVDTVLERALGLTAAGADPTLPGS